MINIYNAMYLYLGYIVTICMIFIVYRAFFLFLALFKTKKLPKAKTLHKYALLIPARNESKVIANLLKSIKNQTYREDLIDIYVTVSDPNDPTLDICKQFNNVTTLIRHNPPKKDCKGFVLNDTLTYIKELKRDLDYDAYFIFDADNILKPDYIELMNDVYDKGYDIAVGYRNCKNWNSSWIADCSALTFTMLNTGSNKAKSMIGSDILITGSGFFISKEKINDLGGWPFHCLTEDVEMTVYSLINNYRSYYYDVAEFYDESPVKLKASINQRLRWVKGYQQVLKKYKKDMQRKIFHFKENWTSCLEYLYSILPLVVALSAILIFIFGAIALGIINLMNGEYALMKLFLVASLKAAVGLYLFFVLFTLILLIIDRDKTEMNTGSFIKALFTNPLFLGLYIPIYFKALLTREVEWVRIDHVFNRKEDEI